MQFGSPEFVLAIIAMAIFAGVMKTAIRARHGLSDPHPHGGGKKLELLHSPTQSAGTQ